MCGRIVACSERLLGLCAATPTPAVGAVVILAASYAAPVSVFIGASLAEALIAISSVIIGASLARFITQRWLGFVSSVLFLAAGVLLIFEAIIAF